MTTQTVPTTAGEYLGIIEASQGDPGRFALLACAFPLALDTRLAEGLISLMTRVDRVQADVLARHVRGLGCVTIEANLFDWYIHVGVRNELVRRAAEELRPATCLRLRAFVSEYAERLASEMKPAYMEDYDRQRGLRYEAAYHRLFDPRTRDAAAAAIVELHDRAPASGKRLIARSLGLVTPEMEFLLGGVPATLAGLIEGQQQ